MPPRRTGGAAGPVELAAPVLEPELLILRQHWKWAAFCQFFDTFSALFNMPDISVNDIEDDLAHTGSVILPRVMIRLLVVLTQDRKITPQNWQVVLRRQYTRRDPSSDPLASIPVSLPSRSPSPASGQASSPPASSTSPPREGSSDKDGEPSMHASGAHVSVQPIEDTRPRDWADLPMLIKLDSLHLLTEWQFQNVNRFRSTLKSDDETANWRIEPIGYDSQNNAYWLIAQHRLWIQRTHPRVSRTSKRKRPPPRAQARQNKRSTRTKAPAPAPTRRSSRASSSLPTTNTPRAAKLKARTQLNKQAQELAKYQASLVEHGTRTSARLRGKADGDDDQWQTIPAEWLAESNAVQSTRQSSRLSATRGPNMSSECDSQESDLTELSSDDDGHGSAVDGSSRATDNANSVSAHESTSEVDDDKPVPSDFVEWETIAVTLTEWERVTDRFVGSTNYQEKALLKLLSSSIVPAVTEHLRELDKQRRLEDAIVSRKKSSRLAGKESMREEARLLELKKAEEAKELARAKRAEAREQREASTREQREAAREQRRLEREKADAEAQAREVAETEMIDVETMGGDRPVHHEATTADSRPTLQRDQPAALTSKSMTRPPIQIECEVCQHRGVYTSTLDPIAVCQVCSRAQHVRCWNTLDQSRGHPPRDWSRAMFQCYRCQPSSHVSSSHHTHGQNGPVAPGHAVPTTSGAHYASFVGSHQAHPILATPQLPYMQSSATNHASSSNQGHHASGPSLGTSHVSHDHPHRYLQQSLHQSTPAAIAHAVAPAAIIPHAMYHTTPTLQPYPHQGFAKWSPQGVNHPPNGYPMTYPTHSASYPSPHYPHSAQP